MRKLDQPVSYPRYSVDPEAGPSLRGQHPEMGNGPMHRVIPDDYAIPATADQIVAGHDLPGCSLERNKHLHDPRFNGPALRADADLECRWVNNDRPKSKRRLVRKNDAYGLSSAIED